MRSVFAKLPQALLPWFAQNARLLPWRETREPYRVWVSEIMLQQTRVEAALGYYARFLEAFPTVRVLADAPQEQLFKLWEGLGYYSRARNLQSAARVICDKYGGVFPDTYDAIRALPGVGPYTAGAIASICFDQPRAAVDGNVLRVSARYLSDDTPVDEPAFKARIVTELEKVYPAGQCGAFTQSLMELGATVCTPRAPKCTACPLRESCKGLQNGTAESLPVKKPKKEKQLVLKSVFLLWCGDRLALSRRAQEGLLAGLWELPNTDEPLSPEGALAWADAHGLQPTELVWHVHRTHVFTHIRWEMEGFTIRCAAMPEAFVRKTSDEIRDTIALPTAFRKFLESE
jgi:A/G-specific adenine glycosylase